MRFTECGPSIPNDLLDARDTGSVVFLCGAGVSIPAGLPDFFCLTDRVARRLGVQAESDAGRLIEVERARRRGTATLSHAGVSFDRIFSLLVSDYGVGQVEAEVSTELTSVRRPRLDYHRALLDLAQGPDGRRQIITTNFDRLFQLAKKDLHTYLPRGLPVLAQPDGFDGILHLHGILPRSQGRLGESLGLVLTSGDFGRAYLADAWATRFVCELLERYTVVLLGYSADDPPVRYLLEGLHLAGRTKNGRIYAFAPGESTPVNAEWRERGVTPIFFDPADDYRHLWETVYAWADRARDPLAWRKRTVLLAQTEPGKLRPFERGQVTALCSSHEGAEEFALSTPRPPAEWLCVFDAISRYWKPGRDVTFGGERKAEVDPLDMYGLDDDPPRPRGDERNRAPTGINLLESLRTDEPVARELGIITGGASSVPRLNRRLSLLASWLQAVMSSPVTAWWAARQGSMHPSIGRQLAWALAQSTGIDPIIHKAWRLILEAREYHPASPAMHDGWWGGVHTRIANEGWTSSALREFADATRPRITVQSSIWSAPTPPDLAIPVILSRIGNFDVIYPEPIQNPHTIPESRLAAVVKVVRHNLELGLNLEEEVGRYRSKLPTLHPEDKPGERILHGREKYFIKFVDMYRRLIEINSAAARAEHVQWPSSGQFFICLKVWILGFSEIVAPAEAGRALLDLDQNVFWDHGYARELLWSIRSRWNELPSHDRRSLERRLVTGRDKFDGESDTDYHQRKASLSAERLIWMQNSDLKLSQATVSKLNELRRVNPFWRESWADSADSSIEGRSGWVKRETDPSVVSRLHLSEIIPRCEQLSERDFQSFVELDPFSGLVEASPQRALRALILEAKRGNFPTRYWTKLFASWPKRHNALRQSVVLATEIADLPDALLVEVRFELGRWLEENFAKIHSAQPEAAYACFDRFLAALEARASDALKSGLGRSSIAGVEVPSNGLGTNFAINSPSGELAAGLVNALFSGKPSKGHRIVPDLKMRLDRLLALPGEGGAHALTVIAQQLHGLYLLDPGWTRTQLLPRFMPPRIDAEAAWSGFLASAMMASPSLFKQLKPAFLEAVRISSDWRCDELGHLGEVLVLALEPPAHGKPLLSAAQARAALAAANPAVRERALMFLPGRISGRNSWRRIIMPFFNDVWPREQRLQTAATTHNIIMFLQGLGDKFGLGVKLVSNFLVQCDDSPSVLFAFSHEGPHGHAELTKRFPHETLLMLSRVIERSRPDSLYGLIEALKLIVEAAPELRHDERWQRLHKLTLGRG